MFNPGSNEHALGQAVSIALTAIEDLAEYLRMVVPEGADVTPLAQQCLDHCAKAIHDARVLLGVPADEG